MANCKDCKTARVMRVTKEYIYIKNPFRPKSKKWLRYRKSEIDGYAFFKTGMALQLELKVREKE